MRQFFLFLITLALFSHVLDASQTQVLTQTHFKEYEPDVSERQQPLPPLIYQPAKPRVNYARVAAKKRYLPGVSPVQHEATKDLQQTLSSSLIDTLFSCVYHVAFFFVSHVVSSLASIPVALVNAVVAVPSFVFLCVYNPVAALGMALRGIYSLVVGIYLSPLYLSVVALASAGASADLGFPIPLTSRLQYGIVEPIKIFLYVTLFFPWIILYGLSTGVHLSVAVPSDDFVLANTTHVSSTAGSVLDYMTSSVETLEVYVFPQEFYNAMMEYALFVKFIQCKNDLIEFIKEMPPGMWDAAWYVTSFMIRTFVPYGDKIVYLLENGGAAYEYVYDKAGAAKDMIVNTTGQAKEKIVEKSGQAKDFVVNTTVQAKDMIVNTTVQASDLAYNSLKVSTVDEMYKDEILKALAKETLPVLLENIEVPHDPVPPVLESAPLASSSYANQTNLYIPVEPERPFRPFGDLYDQARTFQYTGTNIAPPPLRKDKKYIVQRR